MSLGVGKGDRVGIWAPNCAEWVFAQYATAQIGAILVNVNPAYRVHELEYVLNQAGIHTLVAARSFKTSDYAAMIDEVRPRCSALQHVVFIDDPQWTSAIGSPTVALDRDDPINIQYTSGTTGFPKGATLSHHNILNNGYFVGELFSYTENDRICVVPPVLSLLRHGDGQPCRHQPRRVHRHPGPGLRPGRNPCRRSGRALHVALRRADDVHRRCST